MHFELIPTCDDVCRAIDEIGTTQRWPQVVRLSDWSRARRAADESAIVSRAYAACGGRADLIAFILGMSLSTAHVALRRAGVRPQVEHQLSASALLPGRSVFPSSRICSDILCQLDGPKPSRRNPRTFRFRKKPSARPRPTRSPRIRPSRPDEHSRHEREFRARHRAAPGQRRDRSRAPG